MIRKIGLLLLASAFAFQAKSQEVMIDSVYNRSFSGILSGSESRYLYMYYIKNAKDEKSSPKLVFRAYAVGLKEAAKFTYDVTNSTVILGSTYTDRGYLILMGDIEKRTRSLILFNNEGKAVKTIEEKDISEDLLNSDLNYKLTCAMPEGILLLTPLKAKNGGYKLVKYDNELKERWKKEIKGERGNAEIISMLTVADRVILTYRDKVSSGETYHYTINNFQIESGEVMGTVELKDDNNNYIMPVTVNAKDGMSTVAGPYYKDGKITGSEPDGICAMMMGPDGNISKTVKVSFERLKSFLPDRVISDINGGSKIIALDAMSSNNMDFYVVCEILNLKTNTQTQEVTAKASDAFVIKFKDDEVVAADIVPDITPYTTTVKGPVALLNDMSLTEWFVKRKFLHYRFKVNVGGNYQICFTRADSMNIHSIKMPVDSVKTAKPSVMPLDGLAIPKDKKGKKIETQIPGTNNINPDAMLLNWIYNDMLEPEHPKYLYTYRFMPPNITLSYAPYNNP
ncbi:MAG: hypothetical protein JST82_00050 [Bacteroidetes bacterium]|nr:hypothetical protein [Bacteroidota bacterium]